jgi:hypothetical protein
MRFTSSRNLAKGRGFNCVFGELLDLQSPSEDPSGGACQAAYQIG